MINENIEKAMREAENGVLEILAHEDDLTRSDYQGAIAGVLHKFKQAIEIVAYDESLKTNPYTITSIDNYRKYVNTGDNKFLNDIDIEKLKGGDSVVVAYEGGEKEIEISIAI